MNYTDELINDYSEEFPVIISGINGDGEHNVYYVGYDNDEAMDLFDDLRSEWLEYGLGGGDVDLAALHYLGDKESFERALKDFKKATTNLQFEDYFDLDDCEILDIVSEDF